MAHFKKDWIQLYCDPTPPPKVRVLWVDIIALIALALPL